MKIMTLRKANALPRAYRSIPLFFVRIGGLVVRCKNLRDAQLATAYYPQSATITLMTPEDAEAYHAAKLAASRVGLSISTTTQ